MGNKIIWLVSGPRSRASSRIQAYNIHDKLAAMGYNSYILFEPNSVIRKIPLLPDHINDSWIEKGDIVVIQKFDSRGTLDLVKRFKNAGARVVYIDCDLPLKQSLALASDAVIVPSKAYQKLYGSHNISATYIPDCPEKYCPPGQAKKAGNNCIWFGASYGDKWHEVEYFRSILESDAGLKAYWNFQTISDTDRADIRWDDEAIDKISRADLIVIPIPNITDDYSVKSANRQLQSMALGVPVIASNLDAYTEIARSHKLDNMICYNHQDWISNLRFYQNPANRDKAAHSNYDVALNFSIEKIIDQWIEELNINHDFKRNTKPIIRVQQLAALNSIKLCRQKIELGYKDVHPTLLPKLCKIKISEKIRNIKTQRKQQDLT